MIDLFSVTDHSLIYGREFALFRNENFSLPAGRYALLSRSPEYRRLVMDVIGGLRPPQHGSVNISGTISWPIGRSAMLRSRITGIDFIYMIADLYNIDRDHAGEFVTLLVSRPDYIAKSLDCWPPYVRQELNFALGLIPQFDIYLIDAPVPFEESRFTRIWQALFEQRLVGKTLILSSYRPKQMLDYCAKGLVYEDGRLTIEPDLEACIERFPVRPAREDLGDITSGGLGGDDPTFYF